MKKATWQYFSLEEYSDRLSSLRKRMQEKQVDVMMIHTPENLCYLTGYQTPGYYWYQTLIVPMDGEPVFITRLIEATNIEPLTWVEDSRPYRDHENWVAHTIDALKSCGLEDKHIGLEYDSWFLTTRDYLQLTSSLQDTKFVDCSGLVEEGRMIKSSQEIEYIRQAAKASEAGMRAGIEATEIGCTENDVAAAIHSAQIKAGSEYTGLPIFIRSGARNALTHSTWYRKELVPNEGVSFEIPGCINRYHAAQMTNIFLGDPPQAVVKGTEVMVQALDETMNFIKPGITTAHEAHMHCAKVIDDGDLGVSMNHRAAYSIGIGFAPDWGEGHIISMKEGEHTTLQTGMTFHLIPLVFLPGLTSVGTSHTIHITDNGCQPTSQRYMKACSDLKITQIITNRNKNMVWSNYREKRFRMFMRKFRKICIF